MSSAIETPYSDSFGVSATETASLRCRKVSDFEDKYGMVLPYLQKFEFEDEGDFDPKEYCENYCDTDDEEDIYEVANPRETLFKYVNQIRNSFGFDVDCVAPSWFNGSFTPVDLSMADNLGSIFNGANFAIKEISDETNETYALVELEKAVLTRNRIMLLTLSTKKVVGNRNTNADAAMETIQAMVCRESDGSFELDQWRIKPAPVAEDA
ncbi:hypothetical protein C2S52_002177 [Perilla frutescens var. hirtella]|nr:hypothetical protein C2S52_002177 [Perilla frutescens var. hirtella]